MIREAPCSQSTNGESTRPTYRRRASLAAHGGPPILFETMIFGGEHDMWQDRYATIEQARRGHQRVVENLRAGRDPGSESPDEVNW